MFFAVLLFATEEAPKQAPPEGSLFSGMLVPLLLIIPLFYFLMIRPMRRQEQQRQQLINTVEKNDKVLTAAGIYGTVISVSEKEDEVVVKVDDNVRLRMQKASITRNLTKEEAFAAAKAQAAEQKKA